MRGFMPNQRFPGPIPDAEVASPPMRRLVVLLACLGLAGCGAVEDAKREAKQRVAVVERKLERLRDRVEKRVDAALAELERVVPRADARTVVPTRRAASSFEDFMGGVLANVDRYWVRTFRAADLGRPRVARRFVRPGERAPTACGEEADDMAAFYCPADDTIYFGERLGRQVYDSIGDFGVAYALAHEYAHNVQQELGWFAEGARLTTVAPFELQADCMAGTWAYAVYREGRLDEGDVSEAVETALAVGDFDLTNPQHHGTPDQRADAWLNGYRTGDPSVCRRYVTT